MGTDVTDEQARWRDYAVMRSNSVSLVERRVRMALGTAIVAPQYPLKASATMDAKEKDEWRYWQADLLLELQK